MKLDTAGSTLLKLGSFNIVVISMLLAAQANADQCPLSFPGYDLNLSTDASGVVKVSAPHRTDVKSFNHADEAVQTFNSSGTTLGDRTVTTRDHVRILKDGSGRAAVIEVGTDDTDTKAEQKIASGWSPVYASTSITRKYSYPNGSCQLDEEIITKNDGLGKQLTFSRSFCSDLKKMTDGFSKDDLSKCDSILKQLALKVDHERNLLSDQQIELAIGGTNLRTNNPIRDALGMTTMCSIELGALESKDLLNGLQNHSIGVKSQKTDK